MWRGNEPLDSFYWNIIQFTCKSISLGKLVYFYHFACSFAIELVWSWTGHCSRINCFPHQTISELYVTTTASSLLLRKPDTALWALPSASGFPPYFSLYHFCKSSASLFQLFPFSLFYITSFCLWVCSFDVIHPQTTSLETTVFLWRFPRIYY